MEGYGDCFLPAEDYEDMCGMIETLMVFDLINYSSGLTIKDEENTWKIHQVKMQFHCLQDTCTEIIVIYHHITNAIREDSMPSQ